MVYVSSFYISLTHLTRLTTETTEFPEFFLLFSLRACVARRAMAKAFACVT